MRSIIKLSDIIGGTIAMIAALPYVTPQPIWAGERLAMILAALIGLYGGWYVARERHWILKIFLYTGIMLLSLFLVDLAVEVLRLL